MIQVSFYGQESYWTIAEDYDDFLERLLAGRDCDGVIEVVLADGMYGTLGTTMRMTLDPKAIAYYRDLDGSAIVVERPRLERE